VAKRVDMPLRIAGTVDSAEYEYLSYIKPLLNHPLVEYLGEINGNEKHQFFGEAYALICPSDGSEPLDLALIEALACGTPVLAYTRGPHAEIIEHGYTGLMGDTRDGMSALVASISQLDRRICRRQFEERFTAEQMTRDYLSLYTTLTGSRAQGLETSELSSNGSRHAVQQPKDTSMSETAHPTAFEARTMRTVVQ
jgi:glycosyltransferase involved in cell wall biosynthesis